MIKKIASYIVIFGSLSLLVILLFDVAVMPEYVRMGEGRYMVNVKGKTLQYAKKVLASEGYKSLVSDTLYSATYEAGTIVDQYPLPNTRVKEGRTAQHKQAHKVTEVNLVEEAIEPFNPRQPDGLQSAGKPENMKRQKTRHRHIEQRLQVG